MKSRKRGKREMFVCIFARCLGSSFRYKKGETITKTFQSMLMSGFKPDQIGFEKVCTFYITSMEVLLKGNDLKMSSTNNITKLVFPQRFMRAPKNKFRKYLTSILEKVYKLITHFIP